MGEITAISWADHTFNPWIGCTKVSPACDGCYAEALMDKRYGRVEWGATEAQPDAAHVEDLKKTLRLTREYFDLPEDDKRQMHGVYLAGSDVVICHTGTSPNSAIHARIITGALNHLRETAASPPSPSIDPEVHRKVVEALRIFSNPANWTVNGRCDPNSGNFDAITVAGEALALVGEMG